MKAQRDLTALVESLLRLVMKDPDSFGFDVVEQLADTYKRGQAALMRDEYRHRYPADALGIREQDKVRIL